MKRFLTGMLCAGILTSQPAVTYAAETSATPEAGHSGNLFTGLRY